MSNVSVEGIRRLFLDFFVRHGHEYFASAPLIAEGDSTLLFTNAGMVPFKQAFILGNSKVKSAVSSQKCVRAGGKHNDLENVGYTNRHHTFFEMLGNFSFGHYFKDVAIELAWNFITKELCLSKERLWITIYSEDQEAMDIWKKVSGFSEEKIIRISTSDNFWSMGDTGPCGPCSEIFYDYGEGVEGGLPGTAEEDGPRFTEIWNLVFMQFNRDETGELHPLPHKSIDTGMGLERISAVMQGVCDNYETDMFKALIEKSASIFGKPQHPVAHRVIADHIRAATFLIAEGLTPGSEGRNYVLRRIIRRAIRYAYNLNSDEKLSIHEVVPALTRAGSAAYMGDAYPEIVRSEQLIMSVLQSEEEGFAHTLRKGTALLEKEIEGLTSGDILKGDVAFKLYDTYGFPVDITLDVAKEKGLQFDMKGFDVCMQEQKTRSRKHWGGMSSASFSGIWEDLFSKHKGTRFVGYSNHRAKASVLAIVREETEVATANEDEKVFVLLDISPFYGESGGQEGDRGLLTVVGSNASAKRGAVVDVIYTKKAANHLHVHECIVKSGQLSVGDVVEAVVDEVRRKNIRANHSATHILHDVLRTLISKDICQRGSLVAAEKLRFDFNHPSALTKEQVCMLEKAVNDRITANKPVLIDNCSLQEAMQEGAIGLFEEKYNDQNVRVVSMGSSKEMCCGTHVKYTGDIGVFRIVSESGIALGVRRIEAITGSYVLDSVRGEESYLLEISECLGVPVGGIIEKINKMFQENRVLSKKLVDVWQEVIANNVQTSTYGDVPLNYGTFNDIPVDTIVAYIESQKQRQNEIFVFSSVTGEKSVFVIGVGKALQSKISALDFVKVLQTLQGKGGGNASMARVSINSSFREEAETAVKKKLAEILTG